MGTDKKISALYSPYIIDGVIQEETPASMLAECRKGMPAGAPDGDTAYEPITDETCDLPPESLPQDRISPMECMSLIRGAEIDNSEIDRLYPASTTRLAIASAIVQTLWREGHFRLGDLCIKAHWKWDGGQVGNMAAFYKSAEAAGNYIFDLGLDLQEFTFDTCREGCRAEFSIDGVRAEKSAIKAGGSDEDFFVETPFESTHPWLGEGSKCSGTMIPDSGSWIIYIPFDTCRFRLGGSALARAAGHQGGAPSEILDSDYFIDCYEVVRELAEDGIILAGTAAGRGGLLTALDRFRDGAGIAIDTGGMRAAYPGSDDRQILFGEVPGAIIQISGNDYDYVDSQLLLQDIAYYPLGQPDINDRNIRIAGPARPAISGILESLLRNRTSEGED